MISACTGCRVDGLCDRIAELERDLEREKIESKTLRHGLRLADRRAEELERKNAELTAHVSRAKWQAIELRGVIIDFEQSHEFDDVCLDTVKRVQGILGALPGDVERPPAPAAAEQTGEDPAEEKGNSEAFCDANCTWLDHHPDCVRAAAEIGKALKEG